MFGLELDELLENLERLRERLCCYAGPRCDCKFGASMAGEQTGCPEVRQAIVLLSGKEEEITYLRDILEESSRRKLAEIERILDAG